MSKFLKIGWIEFLIALFMGAPVRLRSGKVLQIRYPRPVAPKFLDPSIFGFDFSKYQGVVNFAKVLAYGAKFIVLRCAYAATTDQKFLEYIVECLKYFPNVTSVYHYYDPTVSPISQANKVISVLAPYKGQIKRVWGDFEFYWSGNYQAPANWKLYAETIVAAGYEFGVYTRKTWWDSRVGNFASWFGQFPLWAAQYASSLTLIPAGWSKADIWQVGTPSIGTEVGTQSLEVDYDIMDNDFYAKEYNGVIQPPTGGNVTTLKVLAGALNGRGTPGGVIKYPGGFVLNDILTADNMVPYNGSDWYSITKQMRGDVEIPLPQTPLWASAGATYQYLEIVPETPTEPPAVDLSNLSIHLSAPVKLVIDGNVYEGAINNLELTFTGKQ